MKSGIRLLCLLLCMVMFVSCGQQQKENIGMDTTHSTVSVNSNYYPDCGLRVFDKSNRIFTGKLVSFDEEISWFKRRKIGLFEQRVSKEGKLNLTIEVDGVYKGEYLVGTTVEETYTYSVFFNDVNNRDFWEIGARYLFAFGEFTEGTVTKPVPTNSKHSAIKLNDSGSFELIDGSYDDKCTGYSKDLELNNTYELFYVLFCIRTVELYCRNMYLEYEGNTLKNGYVWNPGENFEYTLEEFYELAEDVYYGEVISVIDEITVEEQLKKLYKVKVKVMTVYKGDLNPGEIIEDITCMTGCYQGKMLYYDPISHSHTTEFGCTGFYFTGGALDLGYSLDSENSAS